MRAPGGVVRVGGVELLLALLALATWCGWTSAFRRDSAAAEASFAVAIAAVVAGDTVLIRLGRAGRLGGLLSPRRRWPGPEVAAAAAVARALPWLVLVVIALAWNVLALDTGTSAAHLTASALAQTFRPVNAALLFAWIAVGFWYGVAESRVPPRPRRAAAPPALAAAPFLARLGSPGPGLLLPDDRAVGIGFWAGFALMALAVQLLARRSAGRLPTLGELFDLVGASRPGLAAIAVIWGYGGWHLFAR